MKMYLVTLMLLLIITSYDSKSMLSESTKINNSENIKKFFKKQLIQKGEDLVKKRNLHLKKSNFLLGSKEMFVLDSLVYSIPEFFGLDSKLVFKLEYDERGNNIKVAGYQGVNEETGEYNPSEEIISVYNNQNQLIDYTEKYYDTENESWYLGTKESYSYNENGDLAEKIIYSEYDGELSISSKEEYQYNELGNIVLRNAYYWDEFNSEWYLSGKTDYTYNDFDNLILNMESYLSGDEWVETTKIEYIYTSGNMTKEVHSDYYIIDENTYEWVENYYVSNTYNVNNQLIAFESYYKYDEEYELEEKMEYAYDEQGNVLESISYYYDLESESIIKDTKMIFSYDYEVSKGEFIVSDIEYISELDFKNMPVKINFEFWETDDWYDIGAFANYYFTKRNIEQVASITPVDNSFISVFPNPTSDFLNIDLSKTNGITRIEILDLSGKTLIKEDILGTNSVNVQNLNRGTYIFKIVQNNKTYGGKFIKE